MKAKVMPHFLKIPKSIIYYSKSQPFVKYSTEVLNIPDKIERSSTDLLKALATTISTDHTAPHYKYHDDPYLIPINYFEKKSYALSKESGRLAAKYFLDRYPKLFEDYIDQPVVKNFYSIKPELKELLEKPDGEEKLFKLIEIEAPFKYIEESYYNIKDKGLSLECQLALLQLFAFHNSTDPRVDITQNCDETEPDVNTENPENVEVNVSKPNEIDIPSIYGDDMYWFKSVTGIETYNKRWKNIGIANELWSVIEEKNAEAYTIMIKALSKYMEVDKVFILFTDMKAQNIPMNLDVYNCLLQVLPTKYDDPDRAWEKAMDIVSEMSRIKIPPNLDTFVNLLCVISQLRNFKLAFRLSLQMLSEMKRCGIKPSLAVYATVLNCYYRDFKSYNTILYDIVDYLREKSFVIVHPRDIEFFGNAMKIAHMNLQDPLLAQKIMDIFEYRDNRILIGHEQNHNLYFLNFFRCLIKFDSLENIINAYDKYIPNEYCLEHNLAKELLNVLAKKFNSDNVITDSGLEQDFKTGRRIQALDEGAITTEKLLCLSEFYMRLWYDYRIFNFIPSMEMVKFRSRKNISLPSLPNESVDYSTKLDREFEYYYRFLGGVSNCIHRSIIQRRIIKKENDSGIVSNLDTILTDRLNTSINSLLDIAVDIKYRLEGEVQSAVKTMKMPKAINMDTIYQQQYQKKFIPFFNHFLQIFYDTESHRFLWEMIETFKNSTQTTLNKSLMEDLLALAVEEKNFNNAHVN